MRSVRTLCGFRPGWTRAQRDEGANQQRRADQQNQGQRDFGGNQQRTGFVGMRARSGASAVFLERRIQIDARCLQRGEEAEEHTSGERDQNREDDHAPIHGDKRAARSDARDVAGIDGEKSANASHAEREPERAAGEGKQQAFGQELANDAPASCADGCTNRDFTLAAGGADQQKIGDIGASDEKNQADRAGQHQQRRPNVQDDRVLKRLNLERIARARQVGEFLVEFLGRAVRAARWPCRR